MQFMDFMDRHCRAIFFVVGVIAVLLYFAGWTSQAYALAGVNGVVTLVGLLRASRDTSRGSFPDGN